MRRKYHLSRKFLFKSLDHITEYEEKALKNIERAIVFAGSLKKGIDRKAKGRKKK